MEDSDSSRLSVSLVDVARGREDELADLVRQMAAVFAAKSYGRVELIRDESRPNRFYAVRYWISAASAGQAHADRDLQLLTTRVYGIARVTHVVNGVQTHEVQRLLLDDRRARLEADRRSGFDRRVRSLPHPGPDRRSGRDRRLGPRRLHDRPDPIDLVGAARRVRENAEAAYSHFKVGAALEAVDGTIFTGCNVENATYGLTVCAERVAVFKAISEGHRVFTRIAVVADTAAPTPPCGACRQILWEFCGNVEVILANLDEEKGRYRLADLLPLPFDARLL